MIFSISPCLGLFSTPIAIIHSIGDVSAASVSAKFASRLSTKQKNQQHSSLRLPSHCQNAALITPPSVTYHGNMLQTQCTVTFGWNKVSHLTPVVIIYYFVCFKKKSHRPSPKPDWFDISLPSWAISLTNDRHENRRIRLFRRRWRQTRAWGRWGSSAPNQAVQFSSSIDTQQPAEVWGGRGSLGNNQPGSGRQQ